MHIFIQEICINFITTATYVCATLHNIIKSLKKKDKEENNSKTNKRTICKNGPHCIIKTPFPFVPHLISREFILGNMAFLAHIQQHTVYQISTSKLSLKVTYFGNFPSALHVDLNISF